VQDPSTAKYDGMPGSAVRSGLATYVLPVEKMPQQLAAYVKSFFENKVRPAPPAPAMTGALSKILMRIRSMTGHDFSLYKRSTINRRIERRIVVHGISNISQYARYLQEHPEEVQILFKELLINVTSFFRDAEAFDVLKKDILAQLIEHKPDNYVFRFWVPGCATGEEVYSLAIILREMMDDAKQEYKVQIFGSDIDEDSVATARTGAYPANISIDVSPERLRRFFIKEEAGYRIKKEIREMVVFAVQNVTRDAPFTKLDLVSCRNLLIYLEPELQGRLIPTFHYALKAGGILFLGPSESIGIYPDLFLQINRKWKIFRSKLSASPAPDLTATGVVWTGYQAKKGPIDEVKVAREPDYAELTRKVLLDIYQTGAVITDEKGTILYVHGDTGRYLRLAPGKASLNIVETAREGLQLDLRSAIHSAAIQKKQMTCRGLQVKTNGGSHGVDLTVRPLSATGVAAGLLLICFQDSGLPLKAKAVRGKTGAGQAKPERLNYLEQELAYTRENLQATVEEMQATNEELKSTNEELQSTNEEMQSTNEELETSKEELQSLNEELVTINSEYQSKIEQLMGLQNDMKNLLDTISVGTIFLDARLAIKRFSREAAKAYRLVASDIGRPLGDIKSNIEGADLVADALEVLDSLVPRDKEVQKSGGGWYQVRVMPYRTLDNVIDGVVLTFTDISALKHVERAAVEARDYAQGIVDAVREPLIVLDGGLKVVSASPSFYRAFGVSSAETVGKYIYDLGNRQWNIPALRELLEKILPGKTSFDNYLVEHTFPDIGHRKILLNARSIKEKEGEVLFILLAMEDITGPPSAPQMKHVIASPKGAAIPPSKESG
jgi:two-component system CheB/CheR fusion protein